MSLARPVVLVGGWDSSRGAGLDADREVLASLFFRLLLGALNVRSAWRGAGKRRKTSSASISGRTIPASASVMRP